MKYCQITYGSSFSIANPIGNYSLQIRSKCLDETWSKWSNEWFLWKEQLKNIYSFLFIPVFSHTHENSCSNSLSNHSFTGTLSYVQTEKKKNVFFINMKIYILPSNMFVDHLINQNPNVGLIFSKIALMLLHTLREIIFCHRITHSHP